MGMEGVRRQQPEHMAVWTVTHRRCGLGCSKVRRWWGRRPASVALDGDLCTGKLSGEQRQRPTWSDHSGGAVILLVRTAATGWRGDVDRGGEVAASDRPGRRVASTCPTSSDRRA
jgi:hypothetical protein